MSSTSRQFRGFLALACIVAGLVVVASLAGILNPGMYLPFTPDELLPGALSQDIVSLTSAAVLLICLAAIPKGHSGLLPVVLGLVGYLFYAYAIYAFDRLYTPFFLVYTAIVGLSVYSIIVFFRTADIPGLQRDRFCKRPPPRRTAAVFLLLLALMFLVRWLGLVLPAIADGVPPLGNSILVLDLSFFLPLLIITALLDLKLKPLGDLLTPVLLIKMGILGSSVLLGEFLRPAFDQPMDTGGIVVFMILGPVSLCLAVLWLRRVGPVQDPA